MKKQINYFAVILVMSLMFCRCEEDGVADFSQPFLETYVEKNSFPVGNENITTGPLKDYESDSEVVYKVTVTSERALSSFKVTTSSDAFSAQSRVLKTDPENAIDQEGNFQKGIKNVVIYYSYHISPLTAASVRETVTFTALNDRNNASSIYHAFTVIKKGSTSGNPLNVIDLSWSNTKSMGIGTQESLFDNTGGTRPLGGNINKRGPAFCFKYGIGLMYQEDVIELASEIDFFGYQTRYAGTNPQLTNNQYYLCSPGDTTVLNTAFAGAQAGAFQLMGTSGSCDISFAGITGRATWSSNVNTTASNFVNAYKNQYAAAGYALSASSGKLIWKASRPVGSITKVKSTTLSGDLTGAEESNQNWIFIDRARETMRKASRKLTGDGKELRTVYFKRLDNINGSNRVTPEDFDILTHDNEFDLLLDGIEEEGLTHAGPMELNQVWGFVMSDGKRGLFRTAPFTVFLDGTDVNVHTPNSNQWKLYGVIKYQTR